MNRSPLRFAPALCGLFSLVVLVFLLLVAGPASVAADDLAPLLLRQPTLSATRIAFAYGGDLWTVAREGGAARRLTAGPGEESHPLFSPDGRTIAFSGEYDGNVDVFTVPAEGGSPTRLTFHPGADVPVAWTPDGSRILFRSSRASYSYFHRLFTVPVAGGFPAEVPLPMGNHGVYSPDGGRLAYVPVSQWQPEWKRYRGGQATAIWIADLADSRVTPIPRDGSNDKNPLWIGSKIYFLSDRTDPSGAGRPGRVSLWVYDTGSGAVAEALANAGLDFKSAAAGPDGAIVVERFGQLFLFDPATGEAHDVDVTLAGDLPAVRPHFAQVEPGQILAARISPTGARAVFEARGEILTVPAEKGDARDLTRTSGVAERDPAWSPDGRSIAYFSDASGEYALHVADPSGLGEPKVIDLGEPPSFFYSPRWSPDGTKIAYSDKRLNLWVVDAAGGKPVLVDTDLFEVPGAHFDPVWSPDGAWLAYTRQLPNHLHAVFVDPLAGGTPHQVTDGLSDALYPAFDRSGKYLYFTASTDLGLAGAWLDMSSLGRLVTRSAYVAVLRRDLPSPLAPESDEEKGKDETKGDDAAAEPEGGKPVAEDADAGKGEADKGAGEAKDAPPATTIDFEGLDQRILALPIPARNYIGLAAGKAGELYLLETEPAHVLDEDAAPPAKVQKFTLAEREVVQLADGVTGFDLSFDGEKMLLRQGDTFVIAATAKPVEPADLSKGKLATDGIEVRVDPRAEWAQMYHEVWRIERDFFYDPHHHGLDLAELEAEYRPYLARVGGRDDLNALFAEMTGRLEVGHTFVQNGDIPAVEPVKAGLLGADYAIEDDRYRFARVYSGENWNPDLRAPLTQPGVNVAAGDYLLAVDGREVRPPANVYSFFEQTAGKQVVLEVGPDPSGAGSRRVTVVPVANEGTLRHLAWIEDNRRRVDELTGGRVAYAHLPDTANGGYTSFNRYFFAQVDREAAVLDERFNTGGLIADYIIDDLRRPPMSLLVSREGRDVVEPPSTIFGPKVMITNEYAGSGGDAMPWYFRKAGIGKLVGKRTWGGLVGIYGYPVLIDGGTVTAPRVAIAGLAGDWEVENHGVAPDVEVELDPYLWRQGHDPQLERAVEIVMEELAVKPVPSFERPPFPDHGP